MEKEGNGCGAGSRRGPGDANPGTRSARPFKAPGDPSGTTGVSRGLPHRAGGSARLPVSSSASRTLPELMGKRLVSLWVWISGITIGFLWVPWLGLVWLCTAPWDPGRYVVGRWFRRAAVLVTTLNPLWKFRVTGVRIPDPRRPYVAVANHESFADIFLISHLPWEMKWLSKESIFKIPFMGWMMRM